MKKDKAINKTPLVSIIIPTHNRSAMLKRSIDSALRQTYKNIEIIVVDDGSTDDTKDVVEYYCTTFKNIQYTKNEVALGACNARNKGIVLASGEFVAGLDDDDEFTSDRIESLLQAHEDQYAFVCSDIRIQKTDGSHIATSFKEVISFDDLLWENLVGSQVLVKREYVLELGGFDESLPSGQDYDLWLRLVQKYGECKHVKQVLYIMHTEHDKPRITTSSKRMEGYFTVYRKVKSHMTKKQKLYNLIVFKKLKQKYVSLKFIFALYPGYYFDREIRTYFYKKVPFLQQLLQQVKKIFIKERDI